MNMKKAIAGILASVVAVSAMATMAVSAVTVNQEEKVVPFDLSEKGWKATNKISAEFAKELDDTTKAGFALATSQDEVKNDSGEVTTAEKWATFTDKNGEAVDVTITISGVKKGVNGDLAVTKEYTTKDGKIAIRANNAAEGEINAALWTGITSIKFSKDLTKTSDKEKVAKDFAEAIQSEEITIANFFGTADTALNAATKLAGKGSYEKAAPEGIELDFSDTNLYSFDKNGYANGIKNNLGYAVTNAIGNKKGAKLVLTFKTEGKLGEVDTEIDGPALDFNKIDGSIKDLAIAPAVGMNFNGLIQGAADVEDGVATFDWDEIVNGSGLAVNSIGLINNIVIGHKNAPKADLKLVLEKVEVKIPAKTVEDITLGEGVEETTPAPVDTDAATDAPADTTAPVENPTTGNAPIALAVIPVALVAAAIVAKKRG